MAPSFMKARFFLPLILLGVLAAAGCGGGGSSTADVQPGDVAVVGGTHIPKAQFDELMAEAKANYKLQGRTFPKAGTTEYSSIKSQAITILVQQAETEAEAAKRGITVTNQDIDKQLTDIKQRCCQGNETKYKAALKQQGLTDQEVERMLLDSFAHAEEDVKLRLLTEQRVEADRTTAAASSAMAADAELLTEADRTAIDGALAALATVRAGSDHQAIRSAIEEVERASKEFVTRRMRRVVELGLRGQNVATVEAKVDETAPKTDVATRVRDHRGHTHG